MSTMADPDYYPSDSELSMKDANDTRWRTSILLNKYITAKIKYNMSVQTGHEQELSENAKQNMFTVHVRIVEQYIII